ncbi:hypothetical protein C8J56DRAFT_1045752 [Mycena floridula]|nr:hypothetical protein C8J56DRAFT_1045752 [Mycena floridula]
MVDNKEKSPAQDQVPSASAHILMALLDRIDQLTAQVNDLHMLVGHSAAASAPADEIKTDSVDDDDTVVVDSQSSGSEAKAASGDDKPVTGSSTSCDLIPEENLHFLTCPNCNHRFPPPPLRESWYVVTVGRQVGVFNDWNVTARHVVGVSGAVFKRYSTKATADAAFLAALQNGGILVV